MRNGEKKNLQAEAVWHGEPEEISELKSQPLPMMAESVGSSSALRDSGSIWESSALETVWCSEINPKN